MRGLGARHNSLVCDSSSALPRDNRKLMSYWRASEASETLLVVDQWKMRYVYTYICISYRPVSRSIVDIKNQGPRAIARRSRFYISTIDRRDQSITYI